MVLQLSTLIYFQQIILKIFCYELFNIVHFRRKNYIHKILE